MSLSKRHYAADAAIVWCFDHRFSAALKRYIKVNKVKHYDLICVAGGAKSLSSPDEASHREFILDQISKSARLHKPRKIMLMTHSDCGAYGGLKYFKNDTEREKKFHAKELGRAKKLLKRHMKDLGIAIEAVFADFDQLHAI